MVSIEAALFVVEVSEVDAESAHAVDLRYVDVEGDFTAKISFMLIGPLAAVVVLDVIEPGAVVMAHLKIVVLSLKMSAIQTLHPKLGRFHLNRLIVVPVNHCEELLEHFGLGCIVFFFLFLLLLVRAPSQDIK